MATVRAPVRPMPPPPKAAASERHALWPRWAALLVVVILLVVAWRWTPLRHWLSLHHLAALLEPYRRSWFALPIVVASYIVLNALMVSVLLLILATGVAFGPWLGSLYALTACLASACVGFLIGRRLGFERMERIGGERVRKLKARIERNGILAVYLIRKVPAPFMVANLVLGASKIRFRDFFLGTLVGMGPIVLALAGFGYHLNQTLQDPTPGKIALAVAFLAVPLGIAWLINRKLRS